MNTSLGFIDFAPDPYNTKCVLLIDDDIDDQIFFTEVIKDLEIGLTCIIANNGLEGLEKMKEVPHLDAIFVDINMPIMNGFQYLEIVKKEKQYQHIPIIMFTTSNAMVDKEMARKLGAVGYISKPNNFQLYRELLRNALLSLFS